LEEEMNIAANIDAVAISWRRLGVAIALGVLICASPSRAWCAGADLWVAAYNSSVIESYRSGQLKTSGAPSPTSVGNSPATGLAFDKAHNLWAVLNGDEVVEYTAAQLKNLKNDSNPAPSVIITSSTFSGLIEGCNFDHQGNLWVVDYLHGSIDQFSKTQLAGSGGSLTPFVVISSGDLSAPDFVTFDAAGDAWVDNLAGGIAEFSASQLTSGGSKPANVVLSDDGSGTSLNEPGEIAFDKKGNLWVANDGADTVVEYAKSQLGASSDSAPMVKLTSAIFDGPWGTVFDSKGDLIVMNFHNGTIAKFGAKQLKGTGAPVPEVSITGNGGGDDQIIFGPAS
jgi:hypothetical protein